MSDKESELGFVAILAAVGLLCILPLLMVLDAWALSHVWHWIVADHFGLRDLSIAECAGISTIAAFFTGHSKESGGTVLLRPFVLLGIGYVVSLFL